MLPGLLAQRWSVGGTTVTLNGSNEITQEHRLQRERRRHQPIREPAELSRRFSDTAEHATGHARRRFHSANPNSGVTVYDTMNNTVPGQPWRSVGGTSFASPAWGALVAIVNQGARGVGTGGARHARVDDADVHDGRLEFPRHHQWHQRRLHTAVPGYDLVTGRGTPHHGLLVAGTVAGNAVVAARVFSDANGNGTLNGESGLADWRVYAELNAQRPRARRKQRSTRPTSPRRSTARHRQFHERGHRPGRQHPRHQRHHQYQAHRCRRPGHHADQPQQQRQHRVTLVVNAGGSGNNYTSTRSTTRPILSSGPAPVSSRTFRRACSRRCLTPPQRHLDLGNQTTVNARPGRCWAGRCR